MSTHCSDLGVSKYMYCFFLAKEIAIKRKVYKNTHHLYIKKCLIKDSL